MSPARSILASTFFFLVPAAFGITNNDNYQHRQDSYLSAYMDAQAPTPLPAGVVYAEPMRMYGPPQPKPMVYYGAPAIPTGLHEHHFSPYGPLLDILSQLPHKLEFLPKVITGFLGITKIFLKVVLLKVILKFITMFCLFFFLPKLNMLDMVTETDASDTAHSGVSSNSSASTSPADALEEEEARLNRMTNFVFDSVENRAFLHNCDRNKPSVKCKMLHMLAKLDEYATIPRLMKTMASNEATLKTS